MLASRFKEGEARPIIRQSGASKSDRMSFLILQKKKKKETNERLFFTVLYKSIRVYVHVLCCRCSCSHSMRIRCTIMHYKSRFVILYFFSSNYAAELSINCSLKIFLYSLFILTPLMTATLALSLNTCTHGVPIIPADSAISGSSAMSIST